MFFVCVALILATKVAGIEATEKKYNMTIYRLIRVDFFQSKCWMVLLSSFPSDLIQTEDSLGAETKEANYQENPITFNVKEETETYL